MVGCVGSIVNCIFISALNLKNVAKTFVLLIISNNNCVQQNQEWDVKLL